MESVRSLAGGNGWFGTEDLMPVRTPAGGEVPGYQSYLCLGWLLSTGLATRHGRSRYHVADVSSFIAAADRAWDGMTG